MGLVEHRFDSMADPVLKWEIAWLEQREQGRLDRQVAEAGIASQVGEAGLTAVDEAGSTTKWMTSEAGLTEKWSNAGIPELPHPLCKNIHSAVI